MQSLPAVIRCAVALLISVPLGAQLAPRLDRVRAAVDRAVASGAAPGAVVLVLLDGKPVVTHGAGWADISGRRPMSTDAIFRLASMTKPVTAMAIMMLVEDGALRLNDRASRYLPELATLRVLTPGTTPSDGDSLPSVAAARQITIRDLLTHRSGLVYGFRDRGPVGRMMQRLEIGEGAGVDSGTVSDMLSRLKTVPLAFQPGSSWSYGLSYDVLGRIVEVVSGQTLEEFFAKRIFQPLGMTDTHFSVPESKWARIPTAYSIDGDATGTFTLRPMRDPERFPSGVMLYPSRFRRAESQRYQSGGTGLYGSVSDYARFLQCLLDGGVANGRRLLSPASIRLMTASHTSDLVPNPVDPGAGFGFGFEVVTDLGQWGTHASVGAYSWDGIYGTEFWVDPAQRLIVLTMMQVFPRRGLTLGVDARTAMYQALTF